jgi:hypothetical protein
MKRILLLVTLLCSTSHAAFSQTTFPNADSVVKYLKGNWRWIRSCGGFAGSCITPTSNPPGPQSAVFNKVTGSPDSIAYAFYKNNILQYSGTSKITYTNTIFGTNWSFDVKFAPPSSISMQLSLSRSTTDSLWIREGCYDCFERSYVRELNPVGINESTAVPLKLFPNPVRNELTISLDNYADVTVRIVDVTGKEQHFPKPEDGRMDVSALAPGLYFIHLISSGASYKSSFIKE